MRRATHRRVVYHRAPVSIPRMEGPDTDGSGALARDCALERDALRGPRSGSTSQPRVS